MSQAATKKEYEAFLYDGLLEVGCFKQEKSGLFAKKIMQVEFTLTKAVKKHASVEFGTWRSQGGVGCE